VGNRFWFYLLCTYVLRVQYSCGVVLVFRFWWEIVFGVLYVLSIQYSCAVVSVFCCGGKLFSKWEHFSTEKSYWVTVLWSASRCVFFIRSNTLLLCISLFCIFLLYRADPQVEVQIRILLRDKYRKLCQKCKNRQSHFDFLKKCLFGFHIYEKQLACQNVFLVRSELSITTYHFLVFYRSTSLQSRLFLKNIDTFLSK
jgi:hypothetical protein